MHLFPTGTMLQKIDRKSNAVAGAVWLCGDIFWYSRILRRGFFGKSTVSLLHTNAFPVTIEASITLYRKDRMEVSHGKHLA